MNLRLTPRQAAIIGAYTGVTCGPFRDVHEYIDSLPGLKGITQLGMLALGEERLRELAREDFLSICAEDSIEIVQE